MPRSLDWVSSQWRMAGGHLKVKLEPVMTWSGFYHFTGDPRQIHVMGAMVHPWPLHHDPGGWSPTLFWHLFMNDIPQVLDIEINGVKWMPDARPDALPAGDRAVFVIDRGFIYAGDWSLSDDEYTLTNAVNLRRYESIGFEGVLRDPKSTYATIVSMPYPVIVPIGSVLFRIPVHAGWGL